MLLQKCRGIDPTLIVDDHGGINKTVSVENSFRRGTITSRESVWDAMADLFTRLPRLLDQRQSCSHCAERAFPNTIRVTARVVDKNVQKRRPFATKSKQCGFDGKRLMQVSEASKRSEQLRIAVAPLLESLLFRSAESEINVTRLNVAMTNFSDLHSGSTLPEMREGLGSRNVAQLLACQTPMASQNDKHQRVKDPSKKRKGSHSFGGIDRNRQRIRETSSDLFSGEIDPAVLAELPTSIAEEVCRNYGILSERNPQTTIEQFFKKRKNSSV